MIATIDVKCNAAHQQLALPVFCTHVGSWSTVKIADVPKKIGLWEITGIVVQYVSPDSQLHSAEAKKINNIWIATLPPTQTYGTSKNGFKIYAHGTDENGNAVSPWTLGVGDVVVLDDVGGVAPVPHVQYMYWLSSQPEELSEQVAGTAWPYEISTSRVHEKGVAVWDGSVAKKLPDSESVLKSFGTQNLSGELDIQQISEGDHVMSLTNTDGSKSLSFYPRSGHRGWEATQFVGETAGIFALPVLEGRHTLAVDVALSDVTKLGHYVDEQISAVEQQLSAKQNKLTDLETSTLTEVTHSYNTIFDQDYSPTYLAGDSLGRSNIPANVQQVNVGPAVKTIASNALSGNTDLFEFTTDRATSLTYIGDRAFEGCYSLGSLTIPRTVNSIGVLAFKDTEMVSIVFEGRSLEDVQAMSNYPWGLADTGIVSAVKEATEAYVDQQISSALGDIERILEAM